MWDKFIFWWKSINASVPVKIPESMANRPENQPHPIEPIKPAYQKRKIAIIVGHSPRDKGAVAYTGIQEFDYNMKVANQIKAILDQTNKFDCKIFYRTSMLIYQAAMQALAKEVISFGADFSLELHFNAAEKVAYGCEILINEGHPNLERCIAIADKWTDDLAKEFSLVERNRYKYKDGTFGDGVKLLKPKERGYYNMFYLYPRVPLSLLIEPMFANVKSKENQQFFEAGGINKYADFLARKIIEL